jgi:hypothetical protein
MLLAPLFLVGLLAIGLPLWLHRFARDTRTKEPFASLMLLEPSQIQRSREHTLKYLLLLALRIALLVLIVLAFAEPVLPWRAPPLEARDRTLHVVVLDTSLSMQQGEQWAQAIERARGVIDAMRPADQGMLVTADSRVRVVRGPVNASDAAELRAALTTITPSSARLDYGMLMTSASSWLGTNRPPTELHFITDLQQTATPLQFADLEPPTGVQLVLHDVGLENATNQYVLSVAPAEHDANTLEVRLGGSAPPDFERTVILTVDGKERGRRTVSPADPRALFPSIDMGQGTYRAVVTLEPADSLPQDDQHFAVIERREARALIVGANSNADDVAYFAAAVGALTNPRLAVERTGADGLSQNALSEYSALVVSDVGVLSNAMASAIQRYLEGGGAVLMTLGPRSAQQDRIPLSGHSRRGGLASSRERDTTPRRVAAVEDSHPALRESQGWRSVRFFRHVPIEARPEDRVLIRLEDGDPLLLERRIGTGRLLVLTSPLDREWNDLGVHPLFVRFVGEAARYLTATAAAPNITVGALLPAASSLREGAQVFDPRGRRVLSLSEMVGQARLTADSIGFYEVRGGGRSEWIAVNADPRESELARMPADSVSQWEQLQTPPATASAAAPEAGSESGSQLKSIWPWLLLIAVTLAFIEPLVANSHLHVRRGVTS